MYQLRLRDLILCVFTMLLLRRTSSSSGSASGLGFALGRFLSSSITSKPPSSSTSSSSSPPPSTTSAPNATTHQSFNNSLFEVVDERTMYSGWRKMLRRDVKFPNEKIHSFDVLSIKENTSSVIVMTWDSKTQTSTLIQEFHPGVQRLMWGTVAGCFEAHKHSTTLEAAQFELEEEAQLVGGQWIPLLRSEETTAPFDKYSDNRFSPYLVIDPTICQNPKPMDDEEYIVVERGVPLSKILDMVHSGEINVASSYTILLAVQKLKDLNLIKS